VADEVVAYYTALLDAHAPLREAVCFTWARGPLRGSVGWCSGEENHYGAEWAGTAHLLAATAEAMDARVPGDDLLPEPDPDFFVEWRSIEEPA
jgi:hypothetical protein